MHVRSRGRSALVLAALVLAVSLVAGCAERAPAWALIAGLFALAHLVERDASNE